MNHFNWLDSFWSEYKSPDIRISSFFPLEQSLAILKVNQRLIRFNVWIRKMVLLLLKLNVFNNIIGHWHHVYMCWYILSWNGSVCLNKYFPWLLFSQLFWYKFINWNRMYYLTWRKLQRKKITATFHFLLALLSITGSENSSHL